MCTSSAATLVDAMTGRTAPRELEAALRSLRLSPQFLWTAIRAKTEDRLREELAHALDAPAPLDTFVAPGVAAGEGRRADIGVQQDDLVTVVIEMKQVWGSDPYWRLDGNTRKAVAAYPVGVKAKSVLHAVMMYEGGRARAAATELGIVLLSLVHVHTETKPNWRKERGLSSEAKLSPTPTETDSLLIAQLESLGPPRGPVILADRVTDAKTEVCFSIHAMFAPVIRLP